jgi:hypothetical protein
MLKQTGQTYSIVFDHNKSTRFDHEEKGLINVVLRSNEFGNTVVDLTSVKDCVDKIDIRGLTSNNLNSLIEELKGLLVIQEKISNKEFKEMLNYGRH